ncbi:MAG: bifunctional phosphoglucose/phosphomannose isomerase [Chlorobi bacterium]|nr:bifunctional phosphoglucose/phosphomannose isomerase [Chlorobiota bacterium]MCI0716982.1 bifunctional phosphoglucose/phosphomannose isomerase [Chlorobiota bacterium]
MITENEIKIYDKSNMFDVLAAFGEQLEEAFAIGKEINLSEELKSVNNIIITGLGGSAIGGDLLKSYLRYEVKIPVVVNRNYYLPSYADRNTLVIASSYSGNTEETLSAYEDAKSKGCKILCVSSGGRLSVIAEGDSNYLIKIPKGYQPRCALGFSFIPLFMAIVKLGFSPERDSEILSLISTIKNKSKNYASFDENVNSAMKLAHHIEGKIPVVYSSEDLLDVVNLRWRGQINENAKSLAFGNYLPEMNHNEIVGWQENSKILSYFAVVYLTDREDNPRVLKRIEITKKLIEPYRGIGIDITAEGKTKLERLFDLIYLGDWISYYLAILYKVDPTPVEKINILKNKLTEN